MESALQTPQGSARPPVAASYGRPSKERANLFHLEQSRESNVFFANASLQYCSRLHRAILDIEQQSNELNTFLTEGDGEDPAFFAAQLEMEQQTDPHKAAIRE